MTVRDLIESLLIIHLQKNENIKIGRWRHYEGMLTCSACNSEFDDNIMEFLGDDVPKFCPECGADMRALECSDSTLN